MTLQDRIEDPLLSPRERRTSFLLLTGCRYEWEACVVPARATWSWSWNGLMFDWRECGYITLIVIILNQYWFMSRSGDVWLDVKRWMGIPLDAVGRYVGLDVVCQPGRVRFLINIRLQVIFELGFLVDWLGLKSRRYEWSSYAPSDFRRTSRWGWVGARRWVG